jgi:hypothetical protein
MHRGRVPIKLIVVLVAVVLLAALVGGWWYMAYGRYPLKGPLHHDFGDVPLTGREGAARTTMQYVNRTGEPVTIRDLKTSCGCLTATADRMTIEPGGTLTLDVEMTFSTERDRRKRVIILIEDFGVQNIWVEGRGTREASP